jgi:hypothetical protein
MEEMIKDLIRWWGVPLQYVLAMEQCSQLATEISHQLRWGKNRQNVVTRVADMLIMIDTIKILLNIDDAEIEKVKEAKLDIALDVVGWDQDDK